MMNTVCLSNDPIVGFTTEAEKPRWQTSPLLKIKGKYFATICATLTPSLKDDYFVS